MLTTSQAAKIVRDCIRFVSDFSGGIDMGDQLQTVGIQSASSQRSLKIEIATNPRIGVASEKHTMSAGDLSFDETSQVSDVASQVVQNATPAPDEAA